MIFINLSWYLYGMSVSFLIFSLQFLHKSKLTEIYANPRKPMKLLKFTQSTGKRVWRKGQSCVFVDTFPPPPHGRQDYLWTLLDTLFIQTQALKIPAGVQDCEKSTNR